MRIPSKPLTTSICFKAVMVFLFITGCTLTNLHSQKKESLIGQTNFEHINNSDGLMHNSIEVSFQDSRGYMWFGSSNGLYKYNGYEFKIYNSELGNEQTLINNKINTITEDSKGTIWIGTNRGLCSYNRDLDVFVTKFHDANSGKEFTFNKQVNSLYIDSEATIWVGTLEGLYRLIKKPSGYEISVFKANTKNNALTNSSITAIAAYENSLLIGTKKGLNQLVFTDANQVIVSEINNKIIQKSYVSSLMVDDDASIWVGTDKGLHKMKLDAESTPEVSLFYLASTHTVLANNSIQHICKIATNKIWISTYTSGVLELNTKEKTVTIHKQHPKNPNSLRSNEINSVFKDRFDVIWVSTTRGGVSKLDLHKKNITHFKNNVFDEQSLSGNVINCIAEISNGDIWVGTFGKGLNILRKGAKHQNFKKYGLEALGSDNIRSICEDNYGNIWLGTMFQGLIQVKYKNGKILKKVRYSKENTNGKLMLNKISISFKDRKGDIWLGGDMNSGLIRLRPSSNFGTFPEITQYKKRKGNTNSLTSNRVFSIFEDSKNNLWVGFSDQGLVKISRDSNNNPIHFQRIKGDNNNPSGLNNNFVCTIHEDVLNNIWIGTFGGGLNKIPKSELDKKSPSIEKYKMEQGLPSNEIYSILEDDEKDLWISTNNGISKYDIRDQKFSNFGLNDNLQGLNFRRNASFKTKEGILYFGGINGFNSMNPYEFETNKTPPLTELVGFKLVNKEVPIGKEVLGKVVLEKSISETDAITLNNEHNSFSIEFASLHFAAPNKNKYKYKLQGFDENWITANSDRRYASYSNLSPGHYTFKVISSNSDGVWNNSPKELELTILPPLWKTWWAYILYVLFFLFLLWLFRRYVLISTDYKNNIKIEKLEQAKIKEVNKLKLEFFTNISHEFKTPLTLILGPLQNILKMEDFNSNVKESLLIMDRNANHLLRLINQVMDFRKAETKQLSIDKTKGNLVDFFKETIHSFKVLADEKDLKLGFESNQSELTVFFDWDKLEKIVNNLISNAIKYTPEKGSIMVSLYILQDSSQIKICVKDTGVGIPKNKISKIFKRFYQVEETSTTNSLGSGVGLDLTKKLVDLLGGEIEVLSSVGKGSDFTVKIPLNVSKLNDDAIVSLEEMIPEFGVETDEQIVGDTAVEKVEHKPSLLIVEDNIDMQAFLKSSLKEKYEVVQAFDGEEGLSLALEIVPDIIISDVMMPNMGGIEFCNEIKQNEIVNHIPIILLTARASVDHRIEGLEVGADAYITKPFDMRFLKTKMKKLLDERAFLREKFAVKGITLDSKHIGLNNSEKTLLEKAEKVIEENLMNSDFRVEDLASALGFSKMQLYRKFKHIRGYTAGEFIRTYRVKKAALLLRETDLNVTEILYAIGFTNRSYFAKSFKKDFHMSPKEYGKKHRDELRKKREEEEQ